MGRHERLFQPLMEEHRIERPEFFEALTAAADQVRLLNESNYDLAALVVFARRVYRRAWRDEARRVRKLKAAADLAATQATQEGDVQP